jgi:hypothetical protein
MSIQTMLDISTLMTEEVVGRFKAVDEEEALAAAETVAIAGKLHYATKHCHCHICQKRGSLLLPQATASARCTELPRRVEAPRVRREDVANMASYAISLEFDFGDS